MGRKYEILRKVASREGNIRVMMRLEWMIFYKTAGWLPNTIAPSTIDDHYYRIWERTPVASWETAAPGGNGVSCDLDPFGDPVPDTCTFSDGTSIRSGDRGPKAGNTSSYKIPITMPLTTNLSAIVSDERQYHILDFEWGEKWAIDYTLDPSSFDGDPDIDDDQSGFQECRIDGFWEADPKEWFGSEIKPVGWGRIVVDDSIDLPDNSFGGGSKTSNFTVILGEIFKDTVLDNCPGASKAKNLFCNDPANCNLSVAYGSYPSAEPPIPTNGWCSPFKGGTPPVTYKYMQYGDDTAYSVCYPHRGVDLGGNGTPLYAPCSGTVYGVGANGNGNVKIECSNGEYVWMMHFSTVKLDGDGIPVLDGNGDPIQVTPLKKGDPVGCGTTPIGFVSNLSYSGTGTVGGAHLHIEVAHGGDRNVYDPGYVIPGIPVSDVAQETATLAETQCTEQSCSGNIGEFCPDGADISQPFTPQCFMKCIQDPHYGKSTIPGFNDDVIDYINGECSDDVKLPVCGTYQEQLVAFMSATNQKEGVSTSLNFNTCYDGDNLMATNPMDLSFDCAVALGKYQIMSSNWSNWCNAYAPGSGQCGDWRNHLQLVDPSATKMKDRWNFEMPDNIQDQVAQGRMEDFYANAGYPSWMDSDVNKWALVTGYWYGLTEDRWYNNVGLYPSGCDYAGGVIRLMRDELNC